MNRVSAEPSFVLHHYDWSESSCIVELLTEHHGRIALIAKGAKKPASHLRAVLLPMQPIEVTYVGTGEVYTLKSAQYLGGYAMPRGPALLAGLYANELILRLLPREAAHARIFALYAKTIACLSALSSAGEQAVALRAFELMLLRQLGWLPDLRVLTTTQTPVQPSSAYTLKAELGLVAAPAVVQTQLSDVVALVGQHWCELEWALQQGVEALQLCIQTMVEDAKTAAHLRTLLRQLLQYHYGNAFQVPQVLSRLRAI